MVVFDMPHAMKLTRARIDFLNSWLPQLVSTDRFATALDAGCGVGYFSAYLAELGLRVTGVDGRIDNILEARSRHPKVRFMTMDIECSAIDFPGGFDFVLCFGLLYHLENPFLAIRNLNRVTNKVLVVESMIVPTKQPIAALVEESYGNDQSLRSIAFVPSERALIKMLYRAGFPYVYKGGTFPDHSDFQATFQFPRRRTILLAANVALQSQMFHPVSEPCGTKAPVERFALGLLYRSARFVRHICEHGPHTFRRGKMSV